MWPHKDNLECCLHCSEEQGDRSAPPPRLPAEKCGGTAAAAAAAPAAQDTFATPSPSLHKNDERQKKRPEGQVQVIAQPCSCPLALSPPLYMCFSCMLRETQKMPPIKPSSAHPHTWLHCKTHTWLCGCTPVSLCIIVSFKHPPLYVLLTNQKGAAFQRRAAKFGACSARSAHLCGSRDLCGGRKAGVLTIAPCTWSLW